MNHFKEEVLEQKGIFRLLTIGLFGLVAVQSFVLVWINITQMPYHIGYDASSYYLKALEMWKQGTLFCDHWVNQTTLYWDSAVPLAAVLMNIFHNIFLSYGVANAIVDISIVLLLWLILEQYDVSILAKLFAVNVAICPYVSVLFNNNINDIGYFSSTFTSGSWYGVKLALALLFIYAYILIKKAQKINVRLLILLSITCVLYFVSGISSGYYMGVTILVPAVVCGISEMFIKNKISILWTKEMIYSYINIILIFVGKFIATRVIHFQSRESNLIWVGLRDFWKNIGSILLGYVSMLQGLPTTSEIEIFSKQGFMYGVGFGIVVITLIAFIVLLIRLVRDFDKYQKVLLPIAVVVFNVIMFAIVYTTYASEFFEERYLIISFYGIIICVAIWIDALDNQLLWKQFGCLVFVTLLILKVYQSDYQYITVRLETSEMDELAALVNTVETPVVYMYGDEYGILQRNMRVYDTNKIYKGLVIGEDGSTFCPHWGDYTYYDNASEWESAIILCTNERQFETIPKEMQEYFSRIGSVGEMNVYVSEKNVLGCR